MRTFIKMTAIMTIAAQVFSPSCIPCRAPVKVLKSSYKISIHSTCGPKIVSDQTENQVVPGAVAINASQRDLIERVIMTSCGGLGIYSMDMANAQVIRDRIKSGRFGRTPEEVLSAKGQFEKPSSGAVDPLVVKAVSAVFDYGQSVSSCPIYYYMNPNFSKISKTTWEKGKRYVETEGHGIFIHEYWTDA